MASFGLQMLLRLLGGKSPQANPYFNNPGSAPYDDSTFDANTQLPAKAPGFWERMAGNDLVARVNADYLSTLSKQPMQREMAKFTGDLALEGKRKGLDIERAAKLEEERIRAEQMGKTAFDVLQAQGNLSQIPGSGGSYENIGRGLGFAYPQIGQQGLTTFSQSEADIARNIAERVASENMALGGRAQQPYITPTTKNISERGLRESSLGLDFVNSKDFPRLYNTGESRKYLKPLEVGNTIFDEATGSIYRGMVPTEKVVNKVMKVGDKEMAIPDVIRSYEPGSVSPFRGVGTIEVPDPTPPRSVNVNPAPAEQSMPSRNQDTTLSQPYNPLIPQTEEEIRALNLWRAQRGLPPIVR